jgi:hypothetical protein
MTAAVLLGAAGLLLVVLGLVTARRPLEPVPDRDAYFDRWSATHGGYDPRTGSLWVRGWLSMVLVMARPLARRGVQPDVVTWSSLWLAGLVLALAGVGGWWAALAGVLVVASALLDSLDGGLAVLEDRQTSWGYVLDSVVDRARTWSGCWPRWRSAVPWSWRWPSCSGSSCWSTCGRGPATPASARWGR